jgi:hypothetical protein
MGQATGSVGRVATDSLPDELGMGGGPLSEAVAAIHRALDHAEAVVAAAHGSQEKERALLWLLRAESRLTSLRLRLMAASDDVAAAHGSRDVAAWLAAQDRREYGAARRDLELGRALDARWTKVGAALADGRIDPIKAQIAVDALDDTTEVLAEEHWPAAEDAILEEATHRRPRALRAVARTLPAVMAPDGADAVEGLRVESEEDHARRVTRLTITPQGDGTSRIHGIVATAVAHRLKTYLDAFTQPRREAPSLAAPFDRADRRRGLALGELLERIDPDALPDHGGDSTTVVVTISEDQLRDSLGAAGLGLDAERLSVGEARRLACEAQILPVVLGGTSEPLDLGRTRRLFTPAQRKAIRLRDARCRAEGCDIEAAWTEIHHRDAWSTGGPTDVSNGTCLCGHHHRRIHDPNYDHSYLPSGDVRFHRRT